MLDSNNPPHVQKGAEKVRELVQDHRDKHDVFNSKISLILLLFIAVVVLSAGTASAELVNNTTENISESFTTLSTSANNLNDGMNDNPILKYIAPDIQRKEDMTTPQKTALSNYKSGNVTEKTVAAEGSLYNTIFGGEMYADIDNPLFNWFFTGRPGGKDTKSN